LGVVSEIKQLIAHLTVPLRNAMQLEVAIDPGGMAGAFGLGELPGGIALGRG
jgi:hypothetical protein